MLVYSDVFDDPNLPGEMKVTVTLNAVAVGTEIHIVQEGIPESLRKLAKLVEPEMGE